MGFLALVALATAIGPLVFDVSPATDRLLSVVEWVVLGLYFNGEAEHGAAESA